MNYNDILFSSCVSNNTNQVKKIFERYNKKTDEIDVLYSDGWLFKIAISNNNFKICEALLSFFEKKQNPSEEEKEKLQDMLEEITSFSKISKEMSLVLRNYVPYEEDSRLEEDFSDLEDIDYKSWLEQMKKENEGSQSTAYHNNSPKQGNILKDIINHHSSGELLTSHNIQLLGQEGVVESKDQAVIEDIKDHQI